MKIFDLSFSDGKTCRVIDPDPDDDAEESLRSYRMMFKPGYLLGMTRIIAPPPERLPWARAADGWMIGGFTLSKMADGSFHCFWPGGEVTGDKDVISSAVRENWHLGV